MAPRTDGPDRRPRHDGSDPTRRGQNAKALGRAGTAAAFVRRVLETDAGRALYGKRQGMIVPVFANTKFNRRIDRFLRPGRAARRSE